MVRPILMTEAKPYQREHWPAKLSSSRPVRGSPIRNRTLLWMRTSCCAWHDDSASIASAQAQAEVAAAHAAQQGSEGAAGDPPQNPIQIAPLQSTTALPPQFYQMPPEGEIGAVTAHRRSKLGRLRRNCALASQKRVECKGEAGGADTRPSVAKKRTVCFRRV